MVNEIYDEDSILSDAIRQNKSDPKKYLYLVKEDS